MSNDNDENYFLVDEDVGAFVDTSNEGPNGQPVRSKMFKTATLENASPPNSLDAVFSEGGESLLKDHQDNELTISSHGVDVCAPSAEIAVVTPAVINADATEANLSSVELNLPVNRNKPAVAADIASPQISEKEVEAAPITPNKDLTRTQISKKDLDEWEVYASRLLADFESEKRVFNKKDELGFDEHFFPRGARKNNEDKKTPPAFSYYGPNSTMTVEKTPMFGVASPIIPTNDVIRIMLVAATKKFPQPLLIDGLNADAVERTLKLAKELGIEVSTRPAIGQSLVVKGNTPKMG